MRRTVLSSESIHFNNHFIGGVLNSSIVSRTDRNGCITFVNQNFEAISGYSEEELVGKTHKIVSSGYHSTDFWLDMWSTIRKGDIWRGEVCNRAKDGSLYWVDTFIYPYSNERGQIEEYFSIHNDITHQKSKKEELISLEANLRTAIDNSNFLIWSISREYVLTSFNNKFATFIKEQYGFEIKLGTCLIENECYIKKLKGQWEPRFNRVFAGENFKLKSEIEDKFYELFLNPIIEEGTVRGATIFCEDITERSKLEEEVVGRNAHLAEIRLMILHATMNPHFVFNTFNAIQYYILKRDRKSAILYFSKFARFLRTTLDNLKLNAITLERTIEMVEYYVELEKLRFDHKFVLDVTIEPEINIQSVVIPPLLIQPFIEKAVERGLSRKKGKGVLKISFRKSHDKILLIEIEDNGISRKIAEENYLKFADSKPFEVSILEEKSKLFNKNEIALLEVIDLEKDGLSTGTLVKIGVKI